MYKNKPWAIVIAGPTCSGKSYLALQIAERLNGIIINADAMQCYKDLRIITARPSLQDEQRIQHRLYGVLSWDQIGNAGWWRQQALSELEHAWNTHHMPILCGGTGMYFHALIHGIALIPEPDPAVRKQARQIVAAQGAGILYEELLKEDFQSVERLNPADSQRIARAWEVWKSSGKGLAYWQENAHLPGADCNFIVIRLAPERSVLRQAVERRFQSMIEQGALEEVAAFARKDPPLTLPLSRAHGVPEFMALLAGECSRQEAIERAVKNIQRYIKRQETWFSHHVLAPESHVCIFNTRIDCFEKFSKRIIEKSVFFINSLVDG